MVYFIVFVIILLFATLESYVTRHMRKQAVAQQVLPVPVPVSVKGTRLLCSPLARLHQDGVFSEITGRNP
jgi:hypothetical protein